MLRNENVTILPQGLLHGDSTTYHLSESEHPGFCFQDLFQFSLLQTEVVDGVFEVCPSTTKFCTLANKPVALGV